MSRYTSQTSVEIERVIAEAEDLIPRLREIWLLAERGYGYRACFGYVLDAEQVLHKLVDMIRKREATT